ncbi:hypothetical protein EIP91_002755 [Steccherinum ochraceum]|uniref:Uncharacterized protein n=1 Tax=Steccherinum ochraceum TaxID=92696 RepID=A0A4V2MW95_9APHY|nr:hypothetical protein EIP91_002755 [Steccherinum ochraceum]
MSLNDRDGNLYGSRGSDVYPGVTNPTKASTQYDPMAANFVTDPTTDEVGAGAGPNFAGGKDATRNFNQTAGVVENRPGIIESTHIDPLDESSDPDAWAKRNAMAGSGTGASAFNTATSMASSAAGMAAGAARMAYGTAVGDENAKRAGKEAVWGKDA